MNIDGFVTSATVLMAGELLITMSAVTGITVFLYFLHASHPSAIRLISNDIVWFVLASVPYIINFMVCWYLSLAFGRLIMSSSLIMETTSKYYLESKIILNVNAFITKHYMFWTESNCFRIVLFVSHLILVAMSEVMSHEKYEHPTIHYTLILLFCLTVLILIAPENAYQHLGITEAITWKRCSLVYGLVTSLCHNWLKSGSKDSTFDMLLVVLVVHVQLVFLCITYFSGGQQLLKNIIGLGTYNPMIDSLDMYFTMDSIMSRMSAYILMYP